MNWSLEFGSSLEFGAWILVLSSVSLCKWIVKNLVHECGVNGIDWRRSIERRGRFASFNKPDCLSHAAAQIVIHHQARVLAHAQRRFRALLKMLARKRTYDQPTCSRQGWHGLAQRYTAYDSSQAHQKTPNPKSQIPKKLQNPKPKVACGLVLGAWDFFGICDL